jgi:uncharacterized protein (TIGR02246 family)
VDRARVRHWIAAYERAWAAGDPSALARLFTDDATYRPSPLGEPLTGRAAIAEWWASASDPAERWEMSSEVLAVEGDRAVARIEVRYTAPERVRYLDLWVMRFAPDGRCAAFEEWWWRDPPAPADL